MNYPCVDANTTNNFIKPESGELDRNKKYISIRHKEFFIEFMKDNTKMSIDLKRKMSENMEKLK